VSDRGQKVAFITGITGQDGSYLSELLLEKGYRVVGFVRRTSTFSTGRIDHLLEEYSEDRFDYVRGDILDAGSIYRALNMVQPDEIYHLAAQSHVGVSFENPDYTVDTVVQGTLRLLEAVRHLKLDCKIYNAASSEMFGDTPPPQSEDGPFNPLSPYAAAKLCAYHMCKLYRASYDMWIANGLLFNHESPRRGETFVTRKITMAVARMYHGSNEVLELGNLYAQRDWGWAPDYVRGMWLMLQCGTPGDYVLATGETHTVKEFVNRAFRDLIWRGSGTEEVATAPWEVELSPVDGKVHRREVVKVNPRFFRPNDVPVLCGDASKARAILGWYPTYKLDDIVKGMVDADILRGISR